MTTILNALKDAYNGAERGKLAPKEFQYSVAKDVSNIKNKTSSFKQSIGKNAAMNLDEGSKLCPVSGECRNVFEGISQGDLKKTMTNGGLLSLYAVPYGGAANADMKMTMKSSNVIGNLV